MSTALLPETSLDIDQLIETEVQALKTRYRSRGFTEAKRPMWGVSEYVRRVLDTHIELIERWGGWRWHSGPLEQVDILPNVICNLIYEVSNQFEEKGLPLQDWYYSENEAYCRLYGCHLPRPITGHVDAYRRKLFTPEDEHLAEQWVEYATRQGVTVRRGRSIAKSVLGEVRKKFKDHPLYIQMWEAIFERLGQAWAGGKALGITLSCAPSDFLLFGHLGESSCYRTGSCHETSKINLSLIKNTLGIFFYRDEVETEVGPDSMRHVQPTGRAWGVVDVETQGAVLTNAYLENWTTTRPSVLRALREAFGFPELVPDMANRGTLSRLGVRHSKKVWAFVNADQHVVAPEGTHQETHLNIAGFIDEFLEKRSIQHGSAATCSTCGMPGVDGDPIRFCNHERRCAHANVENERYEICRYCETRCANCGDTGCRHCVGAVARCANPECNKPLCDSCVKQAKRGEKCCSCCGGRGFYCNDCQDKMPELAACTSCGQKICSVCIARCGRPGCDCGTVCLRCSQRNPLQECERCHMMTCVGHIRRVFGGLIQVCDQCMPEELVIQLDLPEGQVPLTPEDIRRNRYVLRAIPREFLEENYGRMYRYDWAHRPIAG